MKKFLLFLATLLFASSAYAAPKTYNVTLTADNTIWLNDYIDSDTVAKVVNRAKELDSRLPSKEPIYFVLNTGGGSIDAGIEMIENLQNLNRPVHTIVGFAASMGFQTVQGLGSRLILKNGTLMSHKARGGFYGEFPGQLDSRYVYWLKRVATINKVTVARTKGKHTLKSYESLIENEYWCDGQECINQGFADVIVNAKCDKSLTGTRKDNYKIIWGGAAIELIWTYDKCPLNTGELDFQVLVDGEPLFRDNTQTKDKYPTQVYIENAIELQKRIDEIREKKAQKKVKKSY